MLLVKVNIHISFSDKTIGYGDSFNFKVIVDAYPPASITWNKGSTPINHDDNYNLSTENTTSTLTLKNVDSAHAGNYFVEVSNGYHSENISFKVSLYEGEI